MEQDPSWRARLAHSIGRQVHRYRNAREPRMSAQQLADACGIPRSVIAKIESGSRSFVTVDELLVLAKALDVAPLWLLTPVTEDVTEILPDDDRNPWTAAAWFIGERSSQAHILIDYLRVMGQLQRAGAELAEARQTSFAPVDRLAEEVRNLQHALYRVRREAGQTGWTAPEIPENVQKILSGLASGPTDATRS